MTTDTLNPNDITLEQAQYVEAGPKANRMVDDVIEWDLKYSRFSEDPRAAKSARVWLRDQGIYITRRDGQFAGGGRCQRFVAYRSENGIRIEIDDVEAPSEELATARLVLLLRAKGVV